MLGSRCKDEHLKVDEEPPEGGGVGRGWAQRLGGVVVTRGNSDGPNEVGLEGGEALFIIVFEEWPPC